MNDRLTWIPNLMDKNFRAPFRFDEDKEYLEKLETLYDRFIKKIKQLSNDFNYKVIEDYKDRILNIVPDYYNGRIIDSITKVKELIKDVGNNDFAKSTLRNCEAFLGNKNYELQFFRARVSKEYLDYPANKMLHIPFRERYKTNNQRFSMPGYPCLYVANTSYACWIELDKPSEHDFYVSPIIFDGKQKVLNLAVSIENFTRLHDFEKERSTTWLKLIMLMFATSFVYVGDVKNRNFKVEYIIPQLIMQACLNLNYDGIVYNSTKVCSDKFSFAAINLVLFAKPKKTQDNNSSEAIDKYAEICNHIKIADAYNYQLFKQICKNEDWKNYELRVLNTGITTKIGSYDRQFNYSNTNFCDFDKFLFSTWKNKDSLDFGHITNNQV